MTKKLVIVESPSKSKTIEKYLGSDYKVVSSLGHIRDLATTGKYGFGVDIEDNFKPNYTLIKGKKKLVTELKKQVKDADFVYLATDPDREGEAISWHLFETLGLKENEYERIVFNEITKNVILNSFKNARKIDDNLVKSQETRRILDRIIGFRLSKLMQSKTGGKSAGRVQSVALKLIVDREREIEAFQEEEYYEIDAHFKEYDMDSKLDSLNDEKIEIKTEEEAKNILTKLSNDFIVEKIEKKEKEKKGKYPFTTSTLQQEASTKLNFTSKKTMMVAQKLYEGITLKDETVGLISYMRTDSIRLSDEFVGATYHYIEETYGKEYIGYVKKSKKTENVQDAHEAIRPTSIYRTPESVKAYLSNDEFKLYSIIYYRALASLMKSAKVLATTIILNNNNYKFKTTGQIITFDGYLKVYSKYEDSNDKLLPELVENNIINTKDIEYTRHTTNPPARYTESKLIKEMEELGIGRPSTYATTISILNERGYVKVIEKKFHPTEIGIETTDKLQEFFKDIINVKYTKEMEDDLDKIADGKIVHTDLLKRFYDDFEPKVKNAFEEMEKKPPEETGELCPNCGSPMVIKQSRYGKFQACSNYPTCKYIKTEPKEVVEVIDCPKCSGKIIERKTKKGKIFYGCNNYPKCDFATWDKPTGEFCPNCQNPLVEKKDKIKCSKCDYTK